MNSIMEKIKMICVCVGIIEKRKKQIIRKDHYKTHFRHRKDMYRNKGQIKKRIKYSSDEKNTKKN